MSETKAENIRNKNQQKQEIVEMEKKFDNWKAEFMKLNSLEVKVSEEIYQKL